MSCDKTYLNIKMEVEQDESHDWDHDLAKKSIKHFYFWNISVMCLLFLYCKLN